MDRYDLYKDIAERTDGDVYLGVVGPVRTGKSTFIRKFMDLMVLPSMEESYRKERIMDELPQSGSGRTIMTTQPKFVPSEAASISLKDGAKLDVRLVDCVGYMVRGALGHMEEDIPRMVRTPWSDQEMPFEEAAEMGTRKVITDHSTLGVVVTTDGSFTDIPRPSYLEAEERVVGELKELNKPFVIILNTARPGQSETTELRQALEDKYNVAVVAMDVQNMTIDAAQSLLEAMLLEFPLRMITLGVPKWVQALGEDHWLMRYIIDAASNLPEDIQRMRDSGRLSQMFAGSEYVKTMAQSQVSMGEGKVSYELETRPELFYRVLGEECGVSIEGDHQLVAMMKDLIHAKREYDRVGDALHSAWETGYGMVAPTMDELTLEVPELVRQGNRFGVRLKAAAPSLHIMRVDIATEVSPVVGTEKQSEELVQYLMAEFESDPGKIWNTNMFGKSLHDLVRENLAGKLTRMPEDARSKMQDMLSKVINEGNGRMICILL